MTDTLEKARKHLSRKDPVLRPLIKQVGPCTVQFDSDHFGVLVRSIISQQISTNVARAIHGRLAEKLKHRIEPRAILKASEEALRSVGLSQAKALSLRDLAEKCHGGAVR